MGRLALPRNLVAAAEHEGRQEWLASTLPAVIAVVQELWSPTVGEPFQPGGQTAWVAPVRDASGTRLVLKVVWRHPEAAHEAAALRAWAGNAAVRLHAATDLDDAIALLLERCLPGPPLSGCPEPEQDTVIAGLLRRLWIQPARNHPFRSLQLMCQQWADRFAAEAESGGVRLDPGLARAGSSTC